MVSVSGSYVARVIMLELSCCHGSFGIVVPHMRDLSSRGEEEFVDIVGGLESDDETIPIGGDIQE